jgi:SAM-dependent methyltransferase
MMSPPAAVPSAALLQHQAEWLAPARARLLRRIHIARRERVLDLGAGRGAVTAELARRAGGTVVALDCAIEALDEIQAEGAHLVGGDARRLPFPPAHFDLVFSQLTTLWINDIAAAVQEVWRVLMADGVWIALAPDYGGMMEHPPEITTRELWIAGLQRAGADPHVGRKLPGLCAEQGFEVRVDLFNSLRPPATQRFNLLRGLPLTAEERTQLDHIERQAETLTGPWSQVVHLPFFLITATKPPT